MKKILLIFTAAVLLLTLTACSGGGGGSSSNNQKSSRIADDTNVLGMQFQVPEGYETVSRHIGKDADGNIIEKQLIYDFEDGSELIYAFNGGENLLDGVDLSEYESVVVEGITFYLVEYTGGIAAVAQPDEKTVYALTYEVEDDRDVRAFFDQVITGLSFTDDRTSAEDDPALGEIRYEADASWKVEATAVTVTVTPAEELVEKSFVWKIEDPAENSDFQLLIRQFKNTTIAEKTEGSETEEKEINGITYTVVIPSSGSQPFKYYTQLGDDVYMIANSGNSSGWFVSRSDASYAAFDALLNSISFEG